MWRRVNANNKGRGKEGCALQISPRIWHGIEAHGCKWSKIVWAVRKIGIVKYGWICLYATVNVRNRKGKEEMRTFWNYVNECLAEIRRGRRIVLIGDMNGRVANKEIEVWFESEAWME